MLQSVVTKILVGPDPGLLNTPHTRSPRVAHALTRGRTGWPCAAASKRRLKPVETTQAVGSNGSCQRATRDP